MSIAHEVVTVARASTPQPRLVIATILLATLILSRFFRSSKKPPSLPELIPRVSNTILFFKHYSGLLRRAKAAFGAGNIVRFYVGHKTVYLVKGQHNIARLLRTSDALASEGFVLLVFKGMVRMTPEDLDKFIKDKSGRLKNPIPGTEGTHPRYWADNHALYADYLTPAYHTDVLAQRYFSALRERLDALPSAEWSTLQLKPYMHTLISESSLDSMFGPNMIKLTPDIVDLYWEYDRLVNPIIFGAPRWLFKSSYTAQDRFYDGVERWLDDARAAFDWTDEKAVSSDWEPIFGARVSREASQWLAKGGFSKQATVGLFGGLVFGLLANTVSIATWAVIHLLQHKDVLAAARDEARQALAVDENGNTVGLDRQKLVAMPLLQAVFAETLRLHVIFPIMREVMEDIEFEGYTIPKGSYIQGAGGIEHFDEATWAKDGHGVTEFWPERFLVHVERAGGAGKEVVFSTEGKTGKFFPFGGGPGMCPGRHFAKQEVLLTIAALLTGFEIDLVEWTNPDGSSSDREPVNDETYTGTMPPDRDAKIRLKRME